MNRTDLLYDHLKLIYPTASIEKLDDERQTIKLSNIPYSGIVITINLYDLRISFEEYIKVDPKALVTYFKPRIKFESLKFTFNKTELSTRIYDKNFPYNNVGEFERAMWIYSIIEYLIDEIKSIVEQVLKEGIK
jgi:hypothetical protein